MVAKITIPKSLEAALNYNEQKVQKGHAVCLQAANYLLEAKDLNFYQKLAGFKQRNILNDRATTKTLHVSLNFGPSEKIGDHRLREIAELYMEKIGFAEQPFMVYKHEDAGHPHIHIVSTTIRSDGSRINTHNIGRNQSEKARKEIEQLYGLMKAEKQISPVSATILPVTTQKVQYGKTETKRSIANVVQIIFNQYRFCSLPEFNAALKQFNIVADRGQEGSRIYNNRGLVYRILDTNGQRVGVPIKASLLACQPTLDNLEKKFLLHEPEKESLKQAIKNRIEACLETAPGSMKILVDALHQKQIYTALRHTPEGRLYGITFVDNHQKVVFNGSALGKGFSAAALQSRLGTGVEKSVLKENTTTSSPAAIGIKEIKPDRHPAKLPTLGLKQERLAEILLSGKEPYENMSSGLFKKKRKKKKKHPDL